MSSRGLLAQYRFDRSGEAGSMKTGLVLSGGAAQGSFEVGALQFLYSRNFFANIICSTSVGSVNGIQLAHGGTERAQGEAFDVLKMIWEGELVVNEDMYDEAPWLAGVSPETRAAIARVFSGEIDLPSLAAVMIFFPPFAIGQAVGIGIELYEALVALSSAQSVFTLGPTRRKIDAHLDPRVVANSGVELRLVAVSLDSGAIRYITQSGRVIETDGRPVHGSNPTVCTSERSALRDADAMKVATGRAVHQNPRDPEARADFQRADKAAAAGEAALNQCMVAATTAGTATQLTVNVIDGVIASSSIPCVFPPTTLGDEAYVDGGIRWTLPLQAAVDLDPDAIIAVNTSPLGVPPADRNYRNASILDIAERSDFGLELWETQDRHLLAARLQAAQRRQSLWLVAPRFVVHDGFTVDPGLIDINIAYGYMCAADVTSAFPFPARLSVEGAIPPFETGFGDVHPTPVGDTPRDEPLWADAPTDSDQGELADAIAKCRRRCWELEHKVVRKEPSGPMFARRSQVLSLLDFEALDQLRTMKTVLGLLVDARREVHGSLPPGAEVWADNWERHRWRPSDVPGQGDTPWDECISPAGRRDAATRQRVLVAKAPDHDEVYFLNPLRTGSVPRRPSAVRRPRRGRAGALGVPPGRPVKG
jgi:predicted acylesterase/phospholipase RssA